MIFTEFIFIYIFYILGVSQTSFIGGYLRGWVPKNLRSVLWGTAYCTIWEWFCSRGSGTYAHVYSEKYNFEFSYTTRRQAPRVMPRRAGPKYDGKAALTESRSDLRVTVYMSIGSYIRILICLSTVFFIYREIER